MAVPAGMRNCISTLAEVTAFECGAVLNPDHLKNQVEGCVVMGLGGALTEHLMLQIGSTPSTYYLGEPALAGTGSVNASSGELWKYLQAASITAKAPQDFVIAAGLFPSPIGIEVLPVKDNWNWSRSNLFYGLPFAYAHAQQEERPYPPPPGSNEVLRSSLAGTPGIEVIKAMSPSGFPYFFSMAATAAARRLSIASTSSTRPDACAWRRAAAASPLIRSTSSRFFSSLLACARLPFPPPRAGPLRPSCSRRTAAPAAGRRDEGEWEEGQQNEAHPTEYDRKASSGPPKYARSRWKRRRSSATRAP